RRRLERGKVVAVILPLAAAFRKYKPHSAPACMSCGADGPRNRRPEGGPKPMRRRSQVAGELARKIKQRSWPLLAINVSRPPPTKKSLAASPKSTSSPSSINWPLLSVASKFNGCPLIFASGFWRLYLSTCGLNNRRAASDGLL